MTREIKAYRRLEMRANEFYIHYTAQDEAPEGDKKLLILLIGYRRYLELSIES